MFDIFKGLFDETLLTLKFTAASNYFQIVAFTILNTALRAAVIYGGIRLLMTAVSHGSF